MKKTQKNQESLNPATNLSLKQLKESGQFPNAYLRRKDELQWKTAEIAVKPKTQTVRKPRWTIK